MLFEKGNKKPQPIRKTKKGDKNCHGKLLWTDSLHWNSLSISRLHASTQDADNFERFQERAEIFLIKNLPQIKSGKYVFSLAKGLRVTLYTAGIFTSEKLLNIAESFLYADSLELRLCVFLKEAVFSLRRIYRLSTRTVRNRDYFPPTAWLGWTMILIFSSTATHFLRLCQALPCSC